MEPSFVQSAKLAIVDLFGLSKDALHIYVGLLVQLAAAFALRKPIRSVVPWFLVVAAAIAGEILDARDDIESLGHWRTDASLHDFASTLFWPTVFLVLARYSRLFGSQILETAK